MDNRPTEVVVCVDSFNRDVSRFPSSTDFTVSLNGRYDFDDISLGSLEIPPGIDTIETEWSVGFFDTGIAAPSREEDRTLSLTRNGVPRSVVVIPARDMMCASTGDGVWVCVTRHGLTANMLDMMSVVVLRQEDGVPIAHAVTQVLDETRVFTDADDIGLSVSGVLTITNAGTASFASPSQLARVFNSSLASYRIPASLSYDCKSSTFVLACQNSDIHFGGGVLRYLRIYDNRADVPEDTGTIGTSGFSISSSQIPFPVKRFAVAQGSYSPETFATELTRCFNMDIHSHVIVKATATSNERLCFELVPKPQPVNSGSHLDTFFDGQLVSVGRGDITRYGRIHMNGAMGKVVRDTSGDVIHIDGGTTVALIDPCAGTPLNVHFARGHGCHWSRLAEVMGFKQGTNEWVVATQFPDRLLTPNKYNFDPPLYALVEVTLQHASTNIIQRCGDTVINSFMAKVPMYSTSYGGRTFERSYPMYRKSTGKGCVGELRIRILTPWHAAWDLHGREMSALFILGSERSTAHTICK
jgi:hypothetical protein